MTQTFIADYTRKVVKEKATVDPFYRFKYAEHIKTLKEYPADWLTPEMDGKEVECRLQWQLDDGEFGFIDCTETVYTKAESRYRRIVALPIQAALPVEGGKESGEGWVIEYDNDDHGGFSEWWIVSNLNRRYTCETEEDAQWLISHLKAPTPSVEHREGKSAEDLWDEHSGTWAGDEFMNKQSFLSAMHSFAAQGKGDAFDKDKCIDLMLQFTPKSIYMDDPKEVAMYTLFHYIKSLNQ